MYSCVNIRFLCCSFWFLSWCRCCCIWVCSVLVRGVVLSCVRVVGMCIGRIQWLGWLLLVVLVIWMQLSWFSVLLLLLFRLVGISIWGRVQVVWWMCVQFLGVRLVGRWEVWWGCGRGKVGVGGWCLGDFDFMVEVEYRLVGLCCCFGGLVGCFWCGVCQQ